MNPSGGQRSIPEGWRLVRLGDVVQFQQGGTPSKARPEYWDGDIPFVTGADLRETNVSRDNARSFLTNEGLHSGATAICKEGALLLATRTRVGLVGIARELMGASQDITLLAPTEVADQSYLCRTLICKAGLLQQRSRGTTIQGVSREDIDSLPILLPPLPEQQAIADVLDSIDEAIEGAEAVIAATEQLRDSLLHQLLTRGVPGWHTEWKDLPGLGTMPADWEVVRLGEVLESTTYGTNAQLGQEGKVAVLRMNNLQNGEIDLSDVRRASLLEKEGRQLNLVPGDILFNRTNSLDLVGKVAVVRNFPEQVSFASYLIRLRTVPTRANPFWLNALLWSSDCQSRIRRFATPGVSQANINPTSLKSLAIPLPSLSEQEAIAGSLNGVDRTLEQERNQTNMLKLLKDSVADALLTGRVRVDVSRT